MRINVFNSSNEYVKTVDGSEAQVLANVGETESYIEIEEGVDTPNTPTISQDQIDKHEKIARVNNILVTVGGNIFNGNNFSQDRMTSAIQAADIMGTADLKWKLANNTIATVPIHELKEALVLSINKLSDIWLGT